MKRSATLASQVPPVLLPLNPLRKLGRRFHELALRIKNGQVRKPRRWVIGEDLGVEGFFAELRDRQVRYAVLRWFEDLPHVPPGHDVDLLVHDDDVPKVQALLIARHAKPGVKCDLYSVSGLTGTTYRRSKRELGPYFPPDRAEALLERVEQWGLYRVPRVEDHFLSLAYHAVYQKGPSSGVPSRHPQVVTDPSPKHDYISVLAQLSREAGIDVPINMEALDEYLASRGWRPSEPVIEVLRPCNSWIAAHFSNYGPVRS